MVVLYTVYKIVDKIFVMGFMFSEVAKKLKKKYKVNPVTGTFNDFT